MASLSPSQVAAKLARFADDLDGEMRRRAAEAVARRWTSIAESEASADLGGDPKFSGWKPPLDTQTRITADNTLIVMPTKTSAGPWTVAEFGRNRGNGGGGAFFGPGANRATGMTSRTKSGGVRKVRSSAGKRWNGTTEGRGTASRVSARIEDEAPRIVESELGKAIDRSF